MPAPPRIGLLSLSAIPDDPRVRRQGDLLAQAGWQVTAIGLPGAKSPMPDWACLAIGQGAGAAPRSSPSRWLRRPWSLGRRLARQVLLHLDRAQAQRIYWTMNDDFSRLRQSARAVAADLWLANDWTALPIAKALAAEQGVPYAYDTHELAIDEFAQRWRWRLLQRPVIAAIERDGIMGAAFVSCVSQGIADRLASAYHLPRAPIVIRNMPRYEAHAFRPTAGIVHVLYHGLVAPGRGLEASIRSVAAWRPEFTLTIRGPSSEAYAASLLALARKVGVAGRVFVVPPIPMTGLVREAAAFDIGLFALPGHSLQNQHVLPNKFFEYAMAGLALCVSDLPEMSRLLQAYDLGRPIAAATPQAIAEAVNGFDRASIDRHKRNAVAAAHELSWETEAKLLLAACEATVAARRTGEGGFAAP